MDHRRQLLIWLAGFIVSLFPLIVFSIYTREENLLTWVMSRVEISYIFVGLAFAAYCDWSTKNGKLKKVVIRFDIFIAFAFCVFHITAIIAEHELKPYDQIFLLNTNRFLFWSVLPFHIAAYLMDDIKWIWIRVFRLRKN